MVHCNVILCSFVNVPTQHFVVTCLCVGTESECGGDVPRTPAMLKNTNVGSGRYRVMHLYCIYDKSLVLISTKVTIHF